jgi:hypothetical protein
MLLPCHSSQRQMALLSLPTCQLPRLHPLPRSLDRRGDSGPVGSEKKPQGRSSSTSTGPPILPVRALGGAGPDGGRTYQYWPFSSSDLYNWKAQNPPFSEDIRGLTDLFKSICILTVPHGMTVSSSLRLYSPPRNGSGFSLKPERMSPVTMGNRQPCQT